MWGGFIKIEIPGNPLEFLACYLSRRVCCAAQKRSEGARRRELCLEGVEGDEKRRTCRPGRPELAPYQARFKLKKS